MCQINPRKVIDNGWIKICEHSKIAQNGIDCTVKEEVVLKAKSFQNIALNESANIPENAMGMIFPRSSYNRVGLCCQSGVYDSGFVGVIGVNIINLSDQDVIIPKNTRICQIVLISGENDSMYSGFYHGQQTVESKFVHTGGLHVESDKKQ